jgi:transcriptional regulator with XRE-family HTH domain
MQFEAKEVGGRIALARNEAGLTQETLAEMASFSKRSLQDYEAGVTIPYKHMREISRLLAKPVEWFLHGESDSARETAETIEALTGRLEALEGRVAQLPRAETVERGFASLEAAIAELAAQLSPPGAQEV